MQNHFKTQGELYASVTKQICHKSLYKRTAGPKPKLGDCSYSSSICFGNSTLLLPCSISNWHSDPSDNICDSDASRRPFVPLRRCSRSSPRTHKVHARLCVLLPVLNAAETFASQYEKWSHFQFNQVIFSRFQIMNDWNRGHAWISQQLSCTFLIITSKLLPTHLFLL